MRALLQRVSRASVSVASVTIGSIDEGLLVLLGVFREDTEADARWLAEKTFNCRIFRDTDKPMNRSVGDVDGSILVVSQFTLAADTTRGNRPGFGHAAPPERAQALYEIYLESLRQLTPRVCSGQFGADMRVELVNDGPVTILLERT